MWRKKRLEVMNGSFYKSYVASNVQEDDEVDQQDVLKERCGELAKCTKFREELDICNERVTSKSKTAETCEQELFDFVHCVDHCVSTSLIGRTLGMVCPL